MGVKCYPKIEMDNEFFLGNNKIIENSVNDGNITKTNDKYNAENITNNTNKLNRNKIEINESTCNNININRFIV